MQFSVVMSLTNCYSGSITYCKSNEGKMGRTKGAINKEIQLPEVYALSVNDRLELVAKLIIDMISEELCTKD